MGTRTHDAWDNSRRFGRAVSANRPYDTPYLNREVALSVQLLSTGAGLRNAAALRALADR
jgi:hypothetical protein